MQNKQIAMALRFFEEDSEGLGASEFNNHAFSVCYSSPQEQYLSDLNTYLAPGLFKSEENLFQKISFQDEGKLVPQTTDSVSKVKVKPIKIKSMFHNLQKHLTTFLRRVAYIKRATLIKDQFGFLAYELWKVYVSSKDVSKKSLRIIIGSTECQNIENLQRVSRSSAELKKLLSKFSFPDIFQAQALLKKSLYDYLSSVSEDFVKEQCKIGKFQQFYSYLMSFKDELLQENVAMRMKKQRKIELVRKSDRFDRGRKQ